MMAGKTLAAHLGLMALLTTGLGAGVLAQEPRPGESPPGSSMLEVMREEILDTIALDQPVHFTTPQITDTIVMTGTYQVVAGEPAQLTLVAVTNRKTVIVDALTIIHTMDIALPVALYVRDDAKLAHVVLLLPGGQGLEAVGSYDGSRVRSLRSFQLMPSQIQKALHDKLPRKAR